MQTKQMHQLIEQLENYTECWKQFNHFVNIARAKKFSAEEESQFLEVKSVIIQQMEMILASIEAGTPSKEEVLTLVGSAPSLRFLGEMNDSALRNVESQWHKLYIGWHSVLGQLKVQKQVSESKTLFQSFFEKKKKQPQPA
ncbi:MAG TPA: hypothetical protein VFC07_12115 [Verrucomicrobiae bacterium]|nr:hypothetical protein [Verrucomicrobiae bacterium]